MIHSLSNSYQVELLTNSWNRCWGNLTCSSNDDLRDLIIWMYSDPRRHYHNINHLIGCITTVKQYMKYMEFPYMVELAFWVHDLVYDVTSRGNELASCTYFFSQIENSKHIYFKTPDEYIDFKSQITFNVLATAHMIEDSIYSCNDNMFMADIDLITLGADDPTFQDYCHKIRKEYSVFSDHEYYMGRKKFFQSLLDRGFIYQTARFILEYEKDALRNINGELDKINKLLS